MISSLVLASLIPLTACDLAPEFKLPDILAGHAFKQDTAAEIASVEPATDGKWKRVDDKARMVDFAWWRMFGDATLNTLMDQAMKDNPSLEVALERVNAARGLAADRDADLYPAISVGVGPERSRSSPASQEPNLPAGQSANVKPYTLYRAQGTITYELDLVGRNRNRALAAWFDAEGEQDNYLAARLALQAELAQAYFRLSALTLEDQFLSKTLKSREQAIALLRKKYELGAIDALVLSAAEVDFANVRGEAASIADARAQAEHALAILIGQPPAEFKAALSALQATPPSVPAGLPSALLERRPDIKRAVNLMKAANARIGVARTGYFPEISLSAVGGFVSGDLDSLFQWSNRSWTIGPMAGTVLTQPIFEGGRIAAARAQSDANFNASVAEYRGAVLQAFREVEDSLSAVRAANERSRAAGEALRASTRAYAAAEKRFQVGYASHIDFLDAERNHLAAARAEVQTRGQHYIATIQLLRALGGSWDAPSTPEKTGEVTAPEEGRAPEKISGAEQASEVKQEEPAPISEVKQEDLPPAELPDMPVEEGDKKPLFDLNWLEDFRI